MNQTSTAHRISIQPGKPTGPLGFGCGALSPESPTQALGVLQAALDAGVTYFDTARMYAEGRAEGWLGKALAQFGGGRRDKITLVSKVGILPTRRDLGARLVRKASSAARRFGLRDALAFEWAHAPQFGVFDPRRMRDSFERSLRELQTDYLDALLLHECAVGTVADPAVRDFAEMLMQQGKIRAFGIAPVLEVAVAIQQSGQKFGSILQFADSVWVDGISEVRPRTDQLTVTHSCLGAPFRRLLQQLEQDNAAAAWRKDVGVDPRNGDAMAQLFLAYALWRNPAGIVLFSTINPARVAANLRAAESGRFDQAQLAALPQAVRSCEAGVRLSGSL